MFILKSVLLTLALVYLFFFVKDPKKKIVLESRDDMSLAKRTSAFMRDYVLLPGKEMIEVSQFYWSIL